MMLYGNYPKGNNSAIFIIILILLIAGSITALYFLSKPSELSEWSEWDKKCPICTTKGIIHSKKRTRNLTPPTLLGGTFFPNENESEPLEESITCDLMPCPIIIKPSDFNIKGDIEPIIITSTSKDTYNFNKDTVLSKESFKDLAIKEFLVYTPIALDKKDKSNFISYTFNIFKKGSYRVYMSYISPDTGSDSWFFKLDNNEWSNFYTPPNKSDILEWSERRIDFTLDKGEHTLNIAPRETGAILNFLRIEYKQ